MEDVVLHYQPGSAAGLSGLLERTEKLLGSFPCRTPPVFAPWSPAAADRHLPIRPARPAPVITCSAGLLISDGRRHAARRRRLRTPEGHGLVAERTQSAENPQEAKDGACVPETPNHLLPEREVTGTNLHKDGVAAEDSPLRRSWSVFTQKGVPPQSSQSPSKRFHRMVSVHRLHLRQRAKWVIGENNCGVTGDIEQVWRALSRCVRSSRRLPTCNANIQRERAEIWVFCDVVHAEHVGRFLKEELRLLGTIGLSVRRLGNVFSM